MRGLGDWLTNAGRITGLLAGYAVVLLPPWPRTRMIAEGQTGAFTAVPRQQRKMLLLLRGAPVHYLIGPPRHGANDPPICRTAATTGPRAGPRYEVFLCGPEPMMPAARAGLQ